MNRERSPGASLEDRRSKRDERRAKQREQTIVRADAMHRARLAFEAEGRPSTNDSAPAYNVGCSGWFYWHWRGGFYPPEFVAQHLARPLPGSLQDGGVERALLFLADGCDRQVMAPAMRQQPFVYTVKVNEFITHTRRFEGTERLVRDFGLIADLLGPHMGCRLFQLPPSFHYTAARLKSIVGQLDPRRRNVVEFRHRSWWHEDVYDAFRKAGIIFCSCSGPRLPDELIKTADDVYLRFHGTTNWYRHDYTAEELEVWVARYVSAARPMSGRISTTTATRMPSGMPRRSSTVRASFEARLLGPGHGPAASAGPSFFFFAWVTPPEGSREAFCRERPSLQPPRRLRPSLRSWPSGATMCPEPGTEWKVLWPTSRCS